MECKSKKNGENCVHVSSRKASHTHTLSLSLDNSHLLLLCIECRPDQASYLYFMSFAISILEHPVETVEVFVSVTEHSNFTLYYDYT